jgi:NAD(P)H-hydrate epimerase
MDYKLPKLPERKQNSNKGTFGKVLNISGSDYMTGAAYLSSVAALKVGAGYVELLSSDRVLNVVSTLAPEVVLAPIAKLEQAINDSTVISIGCGLSTLSEAVMLFKKVLKLRKNQPIIIDADGLNILSKMEFDFDKKAILTPHPKEASRLLNCSLEEVLKDIKASALQISEKYNCITVLKTHQTIITDGEKFYQNKTGNSALAKAGSGDVLCGMITGLVAQEMDLFDASTLGVYLHGLTGELASKDLTEYGVLATDLINYIPKAYKWLKGF